MSSLQPRWLHAYCLLAGACDATTGALLVAAPGLTLGWMGIAQRPSEPVYLRFVGVFVAAVGLSYLYPFLTLYREARFRVVLETTALIRLAVAVFVGAAVIARALTPLWLSVCATDLALATFQLTVLRRFPITP